MNGTDDAAEAGGERRRRGRGGCAGAAASCRAGRRAPFPSSRSVRLTPWKRNWLDDDESRCRPRRAPRAPPPRQILKTPFVSHRHHGFTRVQFFSEEQYEVLSRHVWKRDL
ncbi:Protein of unknown function [Gryllus bimaculatus]|nr:Protein of unknown function [Gryllus bimaculatus]